MDDKALVGIGIVVVAIAAIVALALTVLIVYLVYNAFKGIPAKHRPMEPGMVWLLLIPCFNLFWYFKVLPPMMKAYKEALTEKGLPVEGDGGESVALYTCICYCCSIIPYLGMLAALAGLVLFIMTLVKAYGYKKQLA